MSDTFLTESLAVLSRTPAVLEALLRDLPEPWITATEGPDTWSPYVVVGHLIHGEVADWLPRLEIIFRAGPGVPFPPFDRSAQFRDSAGKTLPQLLDEFGALRRQSLQGIRALGLDASHLGLTGMHPAFGLVTVRQLIATWTAHDLAHLVQISRVMARRYQSLVGPWAEYLTVLRDFAPPIP